MGPALLALTLLAAPSPAPLWLTLDVANPPQFGGHRLLSLEDVIGPRRRDDIPGLPRPSAVLLFSVTPEGCSGTGLCAEVARRTAEARARGALVIAVVLASKEQAAAARAEVRRAGHPLVVTFDVHNLVRDALRLDVPATFYVIDAEGMNTARIQASKAGDPAQARRTIEQVRTVLLAATGPDEENRR